MSTFKFGAPLPRRDLPSEREVANRGSRESRQRKKDGGGASEGIISLVIALDKHLRYTEKLFSPK